jgi:methionine-rich copper-binding protein CopC
MHRLIVLFVLIVFGSIAGPAAAFAHAHLDHATPAVGSTVAPSPKEVVLVFTGELEPAFSTIEVRSMNGEVMHAGKAVVDPTQPTTMRVPLKSLPPGTYKVIWRILSVDTHRTRGDFTFRIGP